MFLLYRQFLKTITFVMLYSTSLPFPLPIILSLSLHSHFCKRRKTQNLGLSVTVSDKNYLKAIYVTPILLWAQVIDTQRSEDSFWSYSTIWYNVDEVYSLPDWNLDRWQRTCSLQMWRIYLSALWRRTHARAFTLDLTHDAVLRTEFIPSWRILFRLDWYCSTTLLETN